MSENLRDNDSCGSIKSLKSRFQSMQSSNRADGIKKGLNHINDLRKNIGSTLQGMLSGKSDSSVYSKCLRKLDSYGYEKYNLDDDGREIFISKVPEKAFFNDGELLMVRATEGNFVGGSVESASTSIDIGEAQVKVENPRSLFINVPQGSTIETEYRATVGEITADGTVKPRPLDSAFLGRIKSFNSSERPATRIMLENEVPELESEPVVEEASEEEPPRFFQIDDDVETPVKVPIKEPVIEVPEIYIPVAAVAEEPMIQEIVSEALVEKSVFEEPIIKESVFEELAIEEIAIEVPAEEIQVEKALVEEPIEQDAQVPAEHVVSEISTEKIVEEVDIEKPVAVMTLRNIPVESMEPIAGLEMEGSELSAGSSIVEDISAFNMIAQTAETSAEMEPASIISRFNGLEEDGEAYPPLSDPVVKRPRTVRFRFSNGVLQNVESNDNKSEPREELRGPLE